jgi:hypothetical protein
MNFDEFVIELSYTALLETVTDAEESFPITAVHRLSLRGINVIHKYILFLLSLFQK